MFRHQQYRNGKKVNPEYLEQYFLSALYTESSDCQIISLKIGENSHSTFYLDIIYPKTGNNISSLIKNFSIDTEHLISGNLSEKAVHMYLPAFDISYYIDLAKSFEDLGMTNIFGKQNVFSGIFNDSEVTLNQAGQRIKFSLTQTGIETQASSYVSDGTQCGDGDVYYPKWVEMMVSSPFIFQVREANTLTILYMGVINNLEDVEKHYGEVW